MAFADFQTKQKQNKQKSIIREYFTKRNGQLLCLSDDPTILSLLRATVKEMGLPASELVVFVPDPSKLLKAITDSFAAHKRPALFIESVMSGSGETSFMVRQFKESFPDLRIFAMTTTSEKARIMLLYESGADNFILKPISSIDLIDKMAVTLREPSTIRQLLDKARKFVIKNVSSEAIKITQGVLKVKPDSASGYVVLGDALRVSGNRDKAQVAYERACKYSQDYLEPLQKLVDLAKEDGKTDMQLEYLKRLDELSPMNAQRKVEMAELQMEMGNMDEAKKLFDGAVNRAYKNAMQQVALMSEKIAMSLQDKDPAQAEKYLRKCLDLKGKDLTADDLTTFNQLGICLRKQGRWLDAIVEYKRALQIAPNSSELYYNIAMAHAEGKEYENANRFMLKALGLNSSLPRTSPVVAYNMAQVLSLGYSKDKAKQAAEIALELDPDYEPAKKLLAQMKAAETPAV